MSVSGNLRTMPLPDVLQWVAQSRKTGTLVLEGDETNNEAARAFTVTELTVSIVVFGIVLAGAISFLNSLY